MAEDEFTGQHQHHHHHHHHHSRPHLLRNSLIVFAVLLVLSGSAGAAYYSVMGRIGTIETVEYTSPDEEEFETDEDAGEDTMKPEEVKWPSDPAPAKETSDDQTGVTNILIIGQDTRTPGERARSDSMIVFSLNWDKKEANMISIMRDLYVQIPGYSDNRINAAYQFGGTELLDEVIEKNFGVPIDYNVEIDFTGFQEIIDDLGGVYLSLTSAEAAYFQNQGYDARVGMNYMDGAFALAYARTRYVSTATEANDFGRTERQRAVIESIIDAYNDVGVTEKISIMYQILNLVSTDMSDSEIISLIYQSLNLNFSDMGSYRIPIDGAYTDQVIRGMEVLVPDLEKNRTAIAQMIAGTYQ